jgi:hypothetical protein
MQYLDLKFPFNNIFNKMVFRNKIPKSVKLNAI